MNTWTTSKVVQDFVRIPGGSVLHGHQQEYRDSLNRPATKCRICKRDSYLIVAQLSPEFTARLVVRWQQLEEEAARASQIVALPNFADPTGAARAWADQTDARTTLERKVVADAPKVECAETVRSMDADGVEPRSRDWSSRGTMT